ncbi:MAG: hypothetical protein ACLTMP_02560 [Eggerthella lenta]
MGVACLMMPMTAHACAALSLEDIAQGTAIITSFRQIFGALSSSALITVMALASSNELGIDVGGFACFEVQAAVIVVGFVVGMACLLRPQRKTLEAARLSVVRVMLRLPGTARRSGPDVAVDGVGGLALLFRGVMLASPSPLCGQ